MTRRSKERGNAFVYVLIAVVLFAALTFILARQEDTKEAAVISPEQAKLIATQLINTATQIKGAIDQMTFAGTTSDELDFITPGAGGYDEADAADNMHKVFHPDGGGVTLQDLPTNAIDTTVSSPDPDWYLGRFNNVEWTPSTNHEVILAAYGIQEMVCAEINNLLTGSTSIPQLATKATAALFIDNGSQSNDDLTVAECGACDENASLCVKDSGGRYTFYNIMIGE